MFSARAAVIAVALETGDRGPHIIVDRIARVDVLGNDRFEVGFGFASH